MFSLSISSPVRRRFSRTILVLLLVVFSGGTALLAHQIRISDAGGLGSTAEWVEDAAVVYNPDRDEFVVAWSGTDDEGVPAEAGDDPVISVRRVDARTGQPLGGDLVISGYDGGWATEPALAYNSVEKEILVVWQVEVDATAWEIFSRRLDPATLQPLDVNAVQITEMGGEGDPNSSAARPEVVYNPDRNEYLVAFSGRDDRVGMEDLERDVFVQRLDEEGREIGTDDQRISTSASTDEEEGLRGVSTGERIGLAYHPGHEAYLVTWIADDAGAGLADGEWEVFGQLIDAVTGLEIGSDDQRLSVVGPVGSTFFFPAQPNVVARTGGEGFVVTFQADATQGDKEIWAVPVDGVSGAALADRERLTWSFSGASDPVAVWDPVARELDVAFHVFEAVGTAPVLEEEIWVVRAGADLQPLDLHQRWSAMGPDGDASWAGRRPAVAAGPRGALVVWQGDHDQDGQIQNESEIFGRLLPLSGIFTDGFESGTTSAWGA